MKAEVPSLRRRCKEPQCQWRGSPSNHAQQRVPAPHHKQIAFTNRNERTNRRGHEVMDAPAKIELGGRHGREVDVEGEEALSWSLGCRSGHFARSHRIHSKIIKTINTNKKTKTAISIEKDGAQGRRTESCQAALGLGRNPDQR